MKPPATLEPYSPDPREPEQEPGIGSGFPQRPYQQRDLDSPGPSKNYWWVWMIVFAIIGYGCYELYNFENGKKAAIAAKKGAMRPRDIPVVAIPARSGDLPVYLQGLGTVTAFNTVTVKTRVDGQLTQVGFHEGQFVKQGDLLAVVDPRPYQVALDQANGMMAQAKGTLAKDEAALRDAQVNYVRDQELFKDQIIAKQQLDTQLATADQIKGTIQADQASIEAAQASIDSAKLNLAYTRITAPISGRIGLRQVDSGNMIHAADATGLAVITQLQPIAVLFSIPEDQLPSVLQKLRSGVTLSADAYDRDQRKKLASGTLLTVDNEIDQTTGTSKLKAIFPNQDYALFPNQFVNIRLALDTKKNAIIVPSVAIQRGPTGTFVYLVQSDDTVAIRAVKLGLSVENDIAVDDGLSPGDEVVVDGAEKLTEGMKVQVRTPGGQNAKPLPPAAQPGRHKGKRSTAE
jgi:multidrug efflux system membrane fusion protein